ncbi:hypothetical protein CRYUN_Cryun01aG0061000 [Craigia yunnanensis]
MASLTQEEVAIDFVKSYYFHFCQSPKDVQKFCKDSSILSWLGPDGILHHWTILEAIDDPLVSNFGCKEYFLFSIDAQLSIGLGVHVLVIGSMTMDNDTNTKRKFIQSFVLVPMNKPKLKAYFILNDVLRFLDKKETSKTCVQGVDSTVDPVPIDIASKEVLLEASKNCVEGVDSTADPSLDHVLTVTASNEEIDMDFIADPSLDPTLNEAVQEIRKDATAAATATADPSLHHVPADIATNNAVHQVEKDVTAVVNAANDNNDKIKANFADKSVPTETKESSNLHKSRKQQRLISKKAKNQQLLGTWPWM